MKNHIFIIYFLVSLISCKESIPSGIINPQKMQLILFDMLRADALSEQLVKIDSTKLLADEKIKLTNKIFSIHNITKDKFEKSYSYYTQHPDMLRAMFDSLNVQQAKKSFADSVIYKNRFNKATKSLK